MNTSFELSRYINVHPSGVENDRMEDIEKEKSAFPSVPQTTIQSNDDDLKARQLAKTFFIVTGIGPRKFRKNSFVERHTEQLKYTVTQLKRMTDEQFEKLFSYKKDKNNEWDSSFTFNNINVTIHDTIKNQSEVARLALMKMQQKEDIDHFLHMILHMTFPEENSRNRSLGRVAIRDLKDFFESYGVFHSTFSLFAEFKQDLTKKSLSTSDITSYECRLTYNNFLISKGKGKTKNSALKQANSHIYRLLSNSKNNSKLILTRADADFIITNIKSLQIKDPEDVNAHIAKIYNEIDTYLKITSVLVEIVKDYVAPKRASTLEEVALVLF